MGIMATRQKSQLLNVTTSSRSHVKKCANLQVMKRNVKQLWSSIPQISRKQTITSHLKELNTNRPQHMTTLEIQVLAWDRHKNVVVLNHLCDPNPPLLIIGSPTAIQILVLVLSSSVSSKDIFQNPQQGDLIY